MHDCTALHATLRLAAESADCEDIRDSSRGLRAASPRTGLNPCFKIEARGPDDRGRVFPRLLFFLAETGLATKFFAGSVESQAKSQAAAITSGPRGPGLTRPLLRRGVSGRKRNKNKKREDKHEAPRPAVPALGASQACDDHLRLSAAGRSLLESPPQPSLGKPPSI